MPPLDKESVKKVELLLEAIDRVYPSYIQLITKSFVRGLFSGLGATIGVSVVLASLTYFLTVLGILPWLHQFFDRIHIADFFP